jgi:hypothetical protein
MCADSPTILLVGRDFTTSSNFFERLCHSGCACRIARNLAEAREALNAQEFALVLSEMALPDGSAFSLLGLLEPSPATLYFCVAVRDGCWWLPALQRGRRTWGQAALRPAEFAHELETLFGMESLSHAIEQAPAENAESSNVIPMPPVELARPKPQRVEPAKAKSRKSSA